MLTRAEAEAAASELLHEHQLRGYGFTNNGRLCAVAQQGPDILRKLADVPALSGWKKGILRWILKGAAAILEELADPICARAAEIDTGAGSMRTDPGQDRLRLQ